MECSFFIYTTQEDKAKPFFKHQGVCHSLKIHKLLMGILTREVLLKGRGVPESILE